MVEIFTFVVYKVTCKVTSFEVIEFRVKEENKVEEEVDGYVGV